MADSAFMGGDSRKRRRGGKEKKNNTPGTQEMMSACISTRI